MAAVYMKERRSVDGDVVFLMHDRGKQVWWRVTREALEDSYGAHGGNYLSTFDNSVAAIEAVGYKKIHLGGVEPDGTVLITQSDCERFG